MHKMLQWEFGWFFMVSAEGSGLYAGTDPGVQRIKVRTSLPFNNTCTGTWYFSVILILKYQSLNRMID